MASSEERLAYVQAVCDSEDPIDPTKTPDRPVAAPDRIAVAAAAIGEHFGWWYDPVLSPETALEYAEVVAAAARIDKLQAVADRAGEVMGAVHNGYREEIDFMGLWESLVAAGLMPPGEGPDRQDRSSSGEHGPAGATGDTAEPAGPPTAEVVP